MKNLYIVEKISEYKIYNNKAIKSIAYLYLCKKMFLKDKITIN